MHDETDDTKEMACSVQHGRIQLFFFPVILFSSTSQGFLGQLRYPYFFTLWDMRCDLVFSVSFLGQLEMYLMNSVLDLPRLELLSN